MKSETLIVGALAAAGAVLAWVYVKPKLVRDVSQDVAKEHAKIVNDVAKRAQEQANAYIKRATDLADQAVSQSPAPVVREVAAKIPEPGIVEQASNALKNLFSGDAPSPPPTQAITPPNKAAPPAEKTFADLFSTPD